MRPTEGILVAGIVLLSVIMFIYYAKSRRRFTKMFFGAMSGAALLFPAHWLLSAFGAVLSVNVFTVSVSLILGAPGVLLLSAASLL